MPHDVAKEHRLDTFIFELVPLSSVARVVKGKASQFPRVSPRVGWVAAARRRISDGSEFTHGCDKIGHVGRQREVRVANTLVA